MWLPSLKCYYLDSPKNNSHWNSLIILIFSPVKKGDEADVDNVPPERSLNKEDISDFLEEEVAMQKIELLSNKNMAEAIHEFVDKMENDSVST